MGAGLLEVAAGGQGAEPGEACRVARRIGVSVAETEPGRWTYEHAMLGDGEGHAYPERAAEAGIRALVSLLTDYRAPQYPAYVVWTDQGKRFAQGCRTRGAALLVLNDKLSAGFKADIKQACRIAAVQQ